MTVPSTARRAGPFYGTGAAVNYPFTFKVFAKEDLEVTTAITATGVETVEVLDSGYSVTLNVDQDATPGGYVRYAVGGVDTALPATLSLVITGDGLDYEQTADLPQGGNFDPTVVENALDNLEMQIQNNRDAVARSLQLGVTTPSGVDITLPAPVAGDLIGWNDTATGLRNVDPTTLATIVAFAAWQSQTFNGTGAQTAFTLSSDPGNINNLDIAISGVTQTPGADYTLSGTTLTFLSAPPAGTGNIFARWGQALPQGTAALEGYLADPVTPSNGSALIGWLRAATSAVATTLKSWLGWQDIHLFEFMTVAQIADYQSGAMTLDLTAPLQAWLNACAGNRGRLGRGSAKYTTPLTVAAGTTITGFGALSRLVPWGCNAIRLLGDYCTLRDFQIHMTSAVGAADPRTHSGIICEGTGLGDLRSYIDISSVTVRGASSCIDMRYTGNSKLDNVDTFFGTTGVRLYGQCVNNAISNSRLLATGAGSASISLEADVAGPNRGEGLMLSSTLLAAGVNAIKSDGYGFLSLGLDASCIVDLISGNAFEFTYVEAFTCNAQWVYSAGHCFNFNSLGSPTQIDAKINCGRVTCTGGAGISVLRWITNNIGLQFSANVLMTNAAGNYPLVVSGTEADITAKVTKANGAVESALILTAGNRVELFGTRTINWNVTRVATVASVAGTIVLPKNSCKTFIISGALAITSILVDGWDGEEVTLIFSGTATLTNGANLKIGANFVATADDVIKLVCSGANWYRVAVGAVN